MKQGLLIIGCLMMAILLQAQTFEIRSVSKGNGVVGIEMRATSGSAPTTANFVTDLVFGVKWQTSYGIDLVSTITTTYNIKKSGVRTVKGAYHFQAFYADNIPYSIPSNWGLNNWVEIMSIGNSKTGAGTGTFEIAEAGFDATTDPNIGLDLTDHTPVINGNALLVVLPVILSKFEVAAKKTYIDINWSSSAEINNKGFEVQRSAAEASQFQIVGWVEGKGTSSVTSSYSYTDKQVIPGVVYFYRLNQKDYDDKGYLSAIKSASVDINDAAFRLFPNPAIAMVSVLYGGQSLAAKSKIKIIDSKGAVLKEAITSLSRGSKVDMDVSFLPSGQYYLVIEQNGTLAFQKSFQKL